MIHELIDPKKKTTRGSSTTSRSTKPFQEPKPVCEDVTLEGSDTENRESSSTIFIPPWLRNSLGLNQRTNLSQGPGHSDVKSTKLAQRGKEPSQNDFDSVKTNTGEEDCCKKVAAHFEILPQDSPQEVNTARASDDVETVDNNDRTISSYWDVRRKDSEPEWICTPAETKPLKKEDSKKITAEVLTTADLEKLKEEEKKRLKLLKQKNKLRKRLMCDSKQTELDKTDMDFLLELKAREALDDYMKGDVRSVSSEMRHLEAKLLLLSAKSRDSSPKLNQQDLRILQEVKNQAGSVEQLERVFEHVKDVNLKAVIRNPEFLCKSVLEKKQEDKCIMQDTKPKADKDSLLSTDDENDIKRFSEFLSKNKNLDEKRKCLEEVRNYFERKRRTRLTKRRYMEEGKAKMNIQLEGNEEQKEKKFRDVHRGRKSKFSLCDEEVVEKAVDEALQKFMELYHFRVSPSVMGSMKKNILQAIATDSLESSKLSETPSVPFGSKKNSLEVKETAPVEQQDTEITEVTGKESGQKEAKKRNGKTDQELVQKPVSDANVTENEKLKRLKKEFDIFLNSVQSHIDVSNLKLQSIILEKEEQAASNQNVQFVYNFTKKALEPERAEYWQSLKEVLDYKNRKDIEIQTAIDTEPAKRHVKTQALEQKSNCEQSLQTDSAICISQDTQTDGDGVSVREIKELRSYEVNTGLYRMVKSREPGKFYLYPEQQDDSKQEICDQSNSSVLKDKKFNRKRNLVNILSKERTKERQVFFREKVKLKKNKKTPVVVGATTKTPAIRKKKADETSENSISCLYFRDFDKKGSDSISSKKEVDLDERLDVAEELSLEAPREDHVGCFWFWDGEKISPGCDLKAHVENLLKEKLMQMGGFGGNQNEYLGKEGKEEAEEKQDLGIGKVSEKNLDVRNANAMFCFSSVTDVGKESAYPENENVEHRKRPLVMEEKNVETEEIDTNLLNSPQGKPVKNASTQDSHLKFLSLNLSKPKGNSLTSSTVRRKRTRRSIVLKPLHGKMVNIRKAQELLRAVEEIKRVRLELANSKKTHSSDSESLLDCSSSTSSYKNQAEDPLSVVLGLKESPEVEEMSNLEIKNRIKKLMNLVNREVQTTDLYSAEDANSVDNQVPGSVLNHQKHLDLIGRVLSRVSQKQRENLWNDVRHFIKTKVGKDINNEGTREVCIEIEQDMPKTEEGKVKHSVLAKGHYCKDEGDVEVEIDLTLEDLARILRQRQKKLRRRSVYRSSKSKNLLSSSSGHSDLTRDDIRRYQRYLHGFAALSQEKDSRFKKTKGN